MSLLFSRLELIILSLSLLPTLLSGLNVIGCPHPVFDNFCSPCGQLSYLILTKGRFSIRSAYFRCYEASVLVTLKPRLVWIDQSEDWREICEISLWPPYEGLSSLTRRLEPTQT